MAWAAPSMRGVEWLVAVPPPGAREGDEGVHSSLHPGQAVGEVPAPAGPARVDVQGAGSGAAAASAPSDPSPDPAESHGGQQEGLDPHHDAERDDGGGPITGLLVGVQEV